MNVFDAARAAGYTVRNGRQQIMLFHRGRKVGGWNTRDGHWYVSKVAARDRDELLRRNGFRWMQKPGHEWWQLDGEANAGVFAAVAGALTGTPMQHVER